jgi:NADPH-dependent ferric siderophore reductase
VAEITTPRRTRRVLQTRVHDVRRLTPRLIRVVVGGEDLEGFGAGAFADHYVKLQIPPPGAPYTAPFDVEDIKARLPREQWPRTRTYTVQHWDAAQRRLTIDFVHHGDTGVAGPWAATARPGDGLQLLGPGGAYTPDPDAGWHLMIGDESVLPAISASLGRVPAGVPVHVLAEVEGREEQVPLASPGELRLTWLHRCEHPGDEDLLLRAVRELEFPAGAVHAFVHGEAAAVRAVRRHLVVERGIPREALSVSGYWKRDRTEEGWREDKADWNRRVDEDEAAAARS